MSLCFAVCRWTLRFPAVYARRNAACRSATAAFRAHRRWRWRRWGSHAAPRSGTRCQPCRTHKMSFLSQVHQHGVPFLSSSQHVSLWLRLHAKGNLSLRSSGTARPQVVEVVQGRPRREPVSEGTLVQNALAPFLLHFVSADLKVVLRETSWKQYPCFSLPAWLKLVDDGCCFIFSY